MKLRNIEDTMVGALGIELFDNEDGTFSAAMMVDSRTCQIYGYLNGGASLALAENLAGFASFKSCTNGDVPLGISVTANHVASAMCGQKVFAKATALQKGHHLHIWDIDIRDENKKLLSNIRVTNMIVNRRNIKDTE
ncbi:MAG: PaaI family thioesterase [Succinivibrio sp.]